MKKNEMTRQKILDASVEIFFEKGFLDARVDDISNKAGISHGTFYIYFKNKRDVLWDLVKQTFNILYEITEEPWQKGDIYSSLEESLRGFFRIFKDYVKIIRVWKEVSIFDPEFMELWDRLTQKITLRIQKNIQYSIKKSIGKEVNPAIAAQALSGMVEHFAYMLFIKGTNIDYSMEEVVKTLADLWYNSIYIE
ncbi:MAG: TetR/AcrR family transcriptional regulator [Bacillota bacterium]